LPAEQVAVLLLGDAVAVRVDGLVALRSDWTEVIVRPGTHRIEWIAVLPEGLDPSQDLRWLENATRVEVHLQGGHTYSIRAIGLEDETTAQLQPALSGDTR
jgi:hypothetical protein